MSDPFIQQQLALSAPSTESDHVEMAEWRDSLASLLQASGPQRVRDIMDVLAAIARTPEIGWQPALGTPYVNTVPVDRSAGKLPFVADSFSVATGIAMGWDEEDPLAGVVVSSRSSETTSVVARNLYPRLGRVSI